jgi:hypothetical protein
MRRKIIGIAAALGLGVATIATGIAAPFGGHGGGGMGGGHFGGGMGGMGGGGAHFGGGGMGGGMGGGPRFSGSFHGGMAPHMGSGFTGAHFNRFAFHHGFHNRFFFHHHRFFHRRFAFIAFAGDSCWRWRHVWTPFGWHWRRIWVCGY